MSVDKILEQYVNLVKDKIEAKKFISALTHCDKFQENYPDSAIPPYLKGYCYYLLSDYVKSVERYLESIDKDPNYAKAYYNLGVSLYFLERTQDAIRSIEKAYNLFSNQNDLESMSKCLQSLGFIEGNK